MHSCSSTSCLAPDLGRVLDGMRTSPLAPVKELKTEKGSSTKYVSSSQHFAFVPYFETPVFPVIGAEVYIFTAAAATTRVQVPVTYLLGGDSRREEESDNGENTGKLHDADIGYRICCKVMFGFHFDGRYTVSSSERKIVAVLIDLCAHITDTM